MASISAAAPGFARSLSASWDTRIFHDAAQGARVSFLNFGPGQPQLELVEPAGDDSPIARVARAGGGLHHLCFEVPALEEAIDSGRAAGAALVKAPQPAVAFAGRRICWMFTREHLLVEYLEAAKPSPA